MGQTVSPLRFLVQWIESERAGRSVVPDSFWHLSIAGAMLPWTTPCSSWGTDGLRDLRATSRCAAGTA
jgi:hypothetical protein